MRLPIADCRLPIGGSRSRGRFARSRHDGGEFVGFTQKRAEFACWHDAGLNEQFEPKRGFISLLLNDSDFRDEFSLTSGAATGPIVGRDRGATAQDLLGDHPARVIVLGNRSRQLDDSQGKGLGSGFQFGWVHAAKLQIQSPIANRQSAISK